MWTVYLLLWAALIVFGTINHGILGTLQAIGVGLIGLPFAFLAYVMFFYEGDEPPDVCYGNYASEC